MTATAGKILGVSQGGKMATGTSPGGVKESASAVVGFVSTGVTPPPSVPG